MSLRQAQTDIRYINCVLRLEQIIELKFNKF